MYHLEYERGPFIAQFSYNYTDIYLKESASFHGIPYGQEYRLSNQNFPYDGYLNAPVYLKRISALNQSSVEFETEYYPQSIDKMYGKLDVFKPYSNVDYSNRIPFVYLQSDDRQDIFPYQYNNSSLKFEIKAKRLSAASQRVQMSNILLVDYQYYTL